MQKNTQVAKLFLEPRAKFWIASLDDPTLELRAQFNPKELQIDKQVPWQDHKQKDNRSGPARIEKSKQADLEYTGAPKRVMAVELLFDGYEESRSIQGEIAVLETLSSSRNPESQNEEERRPHHCVAAWGDTQDGMRPFRCVVESLSVKYTVWSPSGRPLRATCTVKLTEAEKMSDANESTDYRNRGPEASQRYRRDLALREAEYRDETVRQIEARTKQ